MLTLALALLCIASLIGSGLAVLYIRETRANPPPAALAIGHGALGAASLAVLVLALRRGLPPSDMGTAGFGPIAGGLLALAFGCGLLLAYAAWRQRRPAGALVGTHAGLAIAALALLLTLVALR
jgi:hypothetical protein